MSEFAGLICLNKDKHIPEGEIPLMLEAMRPNDVDFIETFLAPNKRAIMGKLSYAPESSPEHRQNVQEEGINALLIGELYNDDISQYSSAENYLIKRYLQYGRDSFATGLNGSFAAVISDSRDDSVTLITDHINSFPIFTTIVEDIFYFATEVKGLMAVKTIPCKPDNSSIISLVTREFFVRKRTLVENVQRMDNATICNIRDGKVRYRNHWNYIMEPDEDRGVKYYLDVFAELLRQAVHRRIKKGRCAIMLSGGVDSRGILSCLNYPLEIPLITFTEKTLATRPKLGDWVIAENIAEHMGVKLTVIYNDRHDFIRAMRRSVCTSDGAAGFVRENVWEKIRKEVEVDYLIMGDECMGWSAGIMSYNRIMPSLSIHSLQRMTCLHPYLSKDKLDAFIQFSEADIQDILSENINTSAYDCVDEFYLRHRLVNCLNPKRRMISKYGMQVRNPWLDLDVLNFIRKIPVRYRIEKYLFRKTLFKLNQDLYRFPRAREYETGDRLDYLSVIERDNQGISRFIYDDNPLLQDYFDISSTQELLRQILLEPHPTSLRSQFNLRKVLPRPLALKLAATVRYFTNPTPKLELPKQVLRIATVATALRHLNYRMSSYGINTYK